MEVGQKFFAAVLRCQMERVIAFGISSKTQICGVETSYKSF